MWISRLALTDFRNHAQLTLRSTAAGGARGAERRRQDQCAGGGVAAGRRARPAAGGLSRICAPQAAPAAGRSPATLQTAHGPSISAPAWHAQSDAVSARGPYRADQRRAAVGLRRARRSRRDGLADAGHGRPVHGPGWRTPPLPRPAGALLRSGTRRARPVRARHAPAQPPARGRRARAGAFAGLEAIMAETGVAIAAARAEALAGHRRRSSTQRRARATRFSPFPWATLALEGALEAELGQAPPRSRSRMSMSHALATGRDRDRAAGRTLDGPHRSDLVVGHGPKSMPAEASSTGEQKALLIGLVLAHAELLRGRREAAPHRSCCSTRSPPTSMSAGARPCSPRSCSSAARPG